MGAGGSSLGSSTFIPSASMDVKTFNDETLGLQQMADALFMFMFSRWDAREIWDIANKPEDYVIALSDLITNQFHVLGYRTDRNKAGEIYFMKYDGPQGSSSVSRGLAPPGHKKRDGTEYIDDLTQKAVTYSTTGIAQQKQTAKIIAFYFIRLFQIMGSLLFVIRSIPILDEEDERQQSFDTGRRAYTNEQSTLSPIFKPAQPRQWGQPEPMTRRERNQAQRIQQPTRRNRVQGQAQGLVQRIQQGGAIPTNVFLGPYEFLREYVSKPPSESFKRAQGYTSNSTYYRLTDNLYFKYSPPSESDPSIQDQNGRIDLRKIKASLCLLAKTGTNPVIKDIPINIQQTSPPVIQSFNSLVSGLSSSMRRNINDPTANSAQLTSVTFKLGSRSSADPRTNPSYTVQIINSNKDIRAYLFTSINPNIVGGNDILETASFTTILENCVTHAFILNGDQVIKYIVPKERDEYKEGLRRDPNKEVESIKGSTTVDELYQPLRKRTYQPHCVARALQLLDRKYIDSRNIINLPNIKTNICDTKFAGSIDGKKLNEYMPIKLLGGLYGKIDPKEYVRSSKKKEIDPTYEEINASASILEAFVGDKNKLQAAKPLSIGELDKAKQPDEGDDLEKALTTIRAAFDPNSSSKNILTSFADITAAKPAACSDPSSTMITGSTASKLQSISRQLLAEHAKHMVHISKFLQVIFNIKRRPDNTWRVEGPNTEILFAGFPVLDTLTDQARELLVDYYAGCENLYQKGVSVWSPPDVKPVAAPANNNPTAPTQDPRNNATNNPQPLG